MGPAGSDAGGQWRQGAMMPAGSDAGGSGNDAGDGGGVGRRAGADSGQSAIGNQTAITALAAISGQRIRMSKG